MSKRPKAINASIYRFMAEVCPAARQAGPWEAFQVPGLRAGHADPTALVEELTAKFKVDELLRSRVVVESREAHAGFELHPELAAPGGPFVALRQIPRTYDLLTASGCLSGRWLPIIAALRDQQVGQCLAYNRHLFVAFSLADMAALRALRLAATTAVGVSNLGQHGLAEFCSCFRVSRRQDSADGTTSGAACGKAACSRLVLVGWRPSTLELLEPSNWGETLKHLCRLDQLLGLKLDHVVCWRPTASHIEAIQFALHVGSADDVRIAVESSVKSATTGLVTGAPLHDRLDLQKALAQLEVAQESKARVQALASVKRILERDVIGAILAEGAASSDPKVKNLHLLLADVSRMHHEQALQLRVANARPGTDRVAESKERQTLLSITDRVLKLTNELRKWDTNLRRRPPFAGGRRQF